MRALAALNHNFPNGYTDHYESVTITNSGTHERDGWRTRGDNTAMDFNDYTERTDDTASYPEAGSGSFTAINYCVLGISGEAGELPNKWKKFYRDGLSIDDVRESMLAELGDVLWYAARLAKECGTSLEKVAQQNVNKLQSRSRRGVIGGSGDDR